MAFFALSARLVLLALMFATSFALPASSVRREYPSSDPFYEPPAGFESSAPGTILRQRRIVASFFGYVPDPVEAHQLLYRTTAVNGSAIATVTTVFKPLLGAKTDRFVTFHTAYDSSTTNCDPSYVYELGHSPSEIISAAEFLIIQVYLLSGYIVASPDYEGPEAAFSPGHLEGMCVLDGIRAVTNFKDTLGLTSDNPMVVGVGYSGGAIATGWAASMQSTYAPELNVKGWVHGGTPANLTGTLLNIDGTANSGYAPAAVDGLAKSSAYGAHLNPIIDRIATAEGKSVLAYANSHCSSDDLNNFANKSILSTEFQSLGPDLVYEPTIASILLENTMGMKKQQTPTAPVYVYHSKQDEIIPYANVTTLVNSWCSYGANVKFTTFDVGTHAETDVVGLPDAVEFIGSAFAGTTAQGCSRTSELTSSLDPVRLGIEFVPILTALINLTKNA